MPRSTQPEIHAYLKSYEIHIPDIAPVFHWLHVNAGLTWAKVAAAFGITPDRLRAIVSRNPLLPDAAPLPGVLDKLELQFMQKPLVMVPSPELREALGISPNPDDVIFSRRRLEEILQFERQIEIVQQFYVSEGRFEDGLFKMRSSIRRLGKPHSATLMRILARLRHHSAWFLVHLGRTRSAISQARSSVLISYAALDESKNSINLARVAETGLILSMAYQLRNMPEASLNVLKMVDKIHQHFGTNRGSEYFRQLGTSQMQLLQDYEAEKSLTQAGAEGKMHGLPTATVELNSKRQLFLLNRPQWAESRDTLMDANRGIPESDIRHSMNIHWRVAAGLATGEKEVVDHSMELLGPHPPVHFGHQATIRYLFDVTPRLQLEGETLKRWIRYLLYANVFRDE